MSSVDTDKLSFNTDSTMSTDVYPASEDGEPSGTIVCAGSDGEKAAARLTAHSVRYAAYEAKDRRERQRLDRMLLDTSF
jgi:hypothetical protein